jgi:putative transposase
VSCYGLPRDSAWLRENLCGAAVTEVESFFSSLKIERFHGRRYRTRDEARSDIFSYIEGFYNPRRRHSTLDYVSPTAFERLGTTQEH